MKKLDKNIKIDVPEILKDLENYRPRRRNWIWRKGAGQKRLIGKFEFYDMAENMEQAEPLPGGHFFNDIAPQPTSTITTEIASGRF